MYWDSRYIALIIAVIVIIVVVVLWLTGNFNSFLNLSGGTTGNSSGTSTNTKLT